jgi:hypothetical protein
MPLTWSSAGGANAAAPDVKMFRTGPNQLGVEAHILPSVNNTYDVGSVTKFVRSVFTAGMRFLIGTAPASPNNGEIWFDGIALRMQIGGVTKTFSMT